MNILFAISDKFRASEAIRGIADQLRLIGHRVTLIDPKGSREGLDHVSRAHLIDIVHIWAGQTDEMYPGIQELPGAGIVVHLHAGTDRDLLTRVAGFTVPTDELGHIVPAQTPRLILWPGADSKLFYWRPKDQALLAQLRIPINSLVVCYPGDVNGTNERDVRSLYLATAMLNREGVAVTLVRAGRDYRDFLGPDAQWARKYSIELGYLAHAEIARVLSLADFLIQPGVTNTPNDFWLPLKLPEFFAMGRPVIMPHVGVGRFARNGIDAWVLPKVDALGIFEALQHLRSNEALTRKLGEGAAEFHKQHFDWKTSAAKLEGFYREVLDRVGTSSAGIKRSATTFALAESYPE